eukprot:2251697-Ditylum_brightwellii.AAC.1
MHESLRAKKLSCMFQKLEEWFEDNYGIDGELDPFNSAIKKEGNQMYKEEIIRESVATDSDGENNKTTSSDNGGVFYLQNNINENK